MQFEISFKYDTNDVSKKSILTNNRGKILFKWIIITKYYFTGDKHVDPECKLNSSKCQYNLRLPKFSYLEGMNSSVSDYQNYLKSNHLNEKLLLFNQIYTYKMKILYIL